MTMCAWLVVMARVRVGDDDNGGGANALRWVLVMTGAQAGRVSSLGWPCTLGEKLCKVSTVIKGA
jgi:hypothetical protein